MVAPIKEKLAETSIWCDIPVDILIKIAELLKEPKDFLALGAVCRPWRSAASKEYFKGLWLRQEIPYLMLPPFADKEDTREFYSLYDGKIAASVTSSKFKNTNCLESLGWLLVSEEDCSMCLFDPFSNMEIPLPPQTTFPGYSRQFELPPHLYIQKMVLSSRPISEASDFIVMVIWGRMSLLGFWRPGNQAWNLINIRLGRIHDVTYQAGRFYAIDGLGCVWAINLEQNNQQVERRLLTCLIEDDGFNYMNKLPNEIAIRVIGVRNHLVRNKALYILGTYNGSLLLIARTSQKWNQEEQMWEYTSTNEFHVYEVDVHTGLWREIHNLGNMAIFIGYNSTFSVDASRFPAYVKANHIYFTNDDWQVYLFHEKKNGGKGIGVCNLNTGKFEQFYDGELLLNNISPSIWITPYFLSSTRFQD